MENNQINADNGVNVEALLGAREALTQAPEAAQFQWRATSEWVNGTHSRTTIDKFFGLGEEQQHRSAFRFDADHPEIFAAEDNGATPVEFVLVGLASCLTAGIASVAQNRNVQLRSVKATLEAGMDLQGILGIDGDVRNGFDGIRSRRSVRPYSTSSPTRPTLPLRSRSPDAKLAIAARGRCR
jgi:organic hydroperoxide reductase OsmC/OhrA